jgi:hypothetical protein
VTEKYPVYVSYATEGRYAALLRNLRDSAAQYDLVFRDVIVNRAFPSWAQAAAYKSQVILEFIRTENRPIVWLDADAVLRGYPVLFDGYASANPEVDFAAHWRLGQELLSGTLYFGATPSALRLVESWIEIQSHDPDAWDQRTLSIAVAKARKEFTLNERRLPPSYTYIFDRTGRESPGTVPVIEHFQASRGAVK